MNKNQNTETGTADAKTKPGKFWLWGLAVFQLLAVMLLTFVGIEETMTKLCGFVILLLCGSMDIKALKKAGHQVPRWWWTLAVFLPPVYMICRVCKTDKAPSERVKRFAPVVVWCLLFAMLMALGAMLAITEESAEIEERYHATPGASPSKPDLDLRTMPLQYKNMAAGEMLRKFLEEKLDESGSFLKVDGVSDVELIGDDGDQYTWSANVRLSTTRGRPASDVLSYTLSYNNETGYLSYSLADADEGKFDALAEKAAE
jgi:hypothetical protein